jgi:hypothetical protein
MRFSVSVPVLSVQMKVVEPSVSTASSRRTSAPRRAIARADRQRECHCRQEALGNERDGDAYGEEKAFCRGQPDEKPDRKERDSQSDGDCRDRAHEAIELPCEWRRRPVLLARQLGDPRKTRSPARGHHDAGCFPGDHECSRERLRARVGVDGDALTCQQRGVDGQSIGFSDSQIRTHPIARIQDHEIAYNEFASVDLDAPAVSMDGGPAWQQCCELLGSVLGALFLDIREDSVDQDDDEDRTAKLGHPRDDGEPSRRPQHQGKEVEELGAELAKDRGWPASGQLVGPICSKTAMGLDRG